MLTVNKTVARTNDLRADARKLQVCVCGCVCVRERKQSVKGVGSSRAQDPLHLNVTQRALSVTQRALSVTQQALSITQRALGVTQPALSVTQESSPCSGGKLLGFLGDAAVMSSVLVSPPDGILSAGMPVGAVDDVDEGELLLHPSPSELSANSQRHPASS